MTDFDPYHLAAADDLLQVMYWLRGERLASVADDETLERVSGLDPPRIQRALQTLLRRGLIEQVVVEQRAAYRLTDEGVHEGGRRFADEFAELIQPGHGECGDPDCDCHRTGSPEDCRHLDDRS